MIQFFKLHARLPVLIILLACKEEVSRILPDGDGESTFTNPLLTTGPDPWVVQKNGWYYVTHTTGKDFS